MKRAVSASHFAFGAGLFDGGRSRAQTLPADAPVDGTKPNILVIKVDELRFPSVFPPGIGSPAEFLRAFMPNLFQLWQHGVKFTGHYTAATACTPARGTIITGLYSQQSWLVQTILAKPTTQVSLQPWLNPAYPTYGKLLRRAGYQTPYIGKWHVSIPRQQTPRLEEYGFDGLTYYDPTGANLQGTYGDENNGYLNDQDIATQGVQWLQAHAGDEAPWCLTVSFVNPHDREYFWAGTEFQTFDQLFAGQSTYQPFTLYSTQDNPPDVAWDTNALKTPTPLGYPTVPPNWESARQIAANKPSTQTFTKLFSQAVWGGVADDTAQQDFRIAAYPPTGAVPPYGVGVAPYFYWQRGLDSYTQIMTVVDGAIGQVMQALVQMPASVVYNTVIVFMSDHGEYAGAHGYVSGKVGSVYEEAFHVPLIVVDPSGRFTADIDTPRVGLTSSVDILPMLVSLGHGGRRDWLRGNLGQIYGTRHDLLPMLQSSQAAGRPYVLMTTDENVPGYFNFNNSPTHVTGMRTAGLKFGAYANWRVASDQIVDDGTLETELYDYATEAGQAELDNLKGDSRIPGLKQSLLDDLVPNELRAPLPGALGVAQAASKAAYLAYAAIISNLQPSGQQMPDIRDILGFGRDF